MQIKGENNRFALYNDRDQEIGEMTWSDTSESMMIIDHTSADPTYREQKLVEKLVLAGVERVRKEHERIISLCPFARKELDTKSEYGDALRKWKIS